MDRRVLILHAGGTLGMARGGRGWRTEPGYLAGLLGELPELRHPDLPAWELEELRPLLDSASMLPADWVRIAEAIRSRYEEFDGFVLLHGTDTMAYTASALAFMLGGLARPVVLTGSQIPLCEPRTDARENLVTSLLLAAREDLPEVGIYCAGRLYRGCRATKWNATGYDAFDSPNYPALAEVGVEIDVRQHLVRRPREGQSPLEVHAMEGPRVGALRLHPGVSAEVLRNLLQPPLQALVLEAFGVGNGPDRDPAFLEVLAEATGREEPVVVVAVSQCLRGSVRLGQYATGAALAEAGVVGGADMTKEAALAKLHYLLGAGLHAAEVRRRVQQNLRGELTPSSLLDLE